MNDNLKRILSGVALCLFATVAGCNWFSSDPTANADSDSAVGDAATVDMGADDELVSGESGTHARGHRNPHRDTPDPYFILGQPAQEWDVSAWANTGSLDIAEPITLEKLRGKVVVVHFWVDGDEGSARTMAALNELANEFRNEPVVFVGIFLTSESIADDPWGVAQALADDLKISFPIAADSSTQIMWWRTRYDHLPNTPTFVIGPKGDIVHLHPGPEIFPSDKVSEAICDQDYRLLTNAIQTALGHQLADTRADG